MDTNLIISLIFTESKTIQTSEYVDDAFCSSGSPSDTTSLFATHCSLRANKHSSSSATHNSTSSFASISSSVSNNQEENSLGTSPVHGLMSEAPTNNVIPSVTSSSLPNSNCDRTLPSYPYPPSPTISLEKPSNSYATDPASIPTPYTLLSDQQSLHTPVRCVSNGEKLVLANVDNGAEPIDTSPSSSPKFLSTKSVSPRQSPRLARSRCNSSPTAALKQTDPVEETTAC